MKKALLHSTPNSLLLIDEFGKGTIPTDGIAIFAATLKTLAQRPSPPRTIAITHFHEIHKKALLQPELPIKWYTMDTVQDDRIIFLYKLVSGKAIDSLGISCAKSTGIPSEIIKRAEDLLVLYESQAEPLSIRYASLNPALEAAAEALIEAALNVESEFSELREQANRLLALPHQ